MQRLSEIEQNQAIGILAVEMSARVVARRFGCCRKTIDRLAARYQQTGTVHDRQRPGRPRVTTARADSLITLTHFSIGSHSHC